MTNEIIHDDPKLADLLRLDSYLMAAARELEENARQARDLVEKILCRYPLRHVRQGRARKIRLVLKRETEEILRELCEAVAGVDGHALDEDALLATLAMAVLRGPDELRRLAVDEEQREEERGPRPSRSRPPVRGSDRTRGSAKRRPRRKRRR